MQDDRRAKLSMGYTVYMHVAPNGKRYIGITGQKPARRWDNGRGYARNVLFNRAIQKYGWDNIDHVILRENMTEAEAKQAEIEYIAAYKSNDKRFGYNLSYGGEGTNGVPAWNKGMRGVMVAWNKGKKTPPDVRTKLSAAHKGKRLTEEHKKKIGRKGNANAKSIAVVCVETGEEFESINLAAIAHNTALTNIAKVCRGERKRAGGYHWRYAGAQ